MFDRRSFLAAGAGLATGLIASPQAQAAEDPDMSAFIAALPKAELHLHLEGSLEAEMKFALAKRNGVALPYPTVEAMKRSYVFHDLPSFLAVYYEGKTVLVKEQDFYDLAYAYLTKAASQNVLYSEMFFDPQQHMDRGIPLATVMGGLTRARIDAQKNLGIHSRLILCFMRDLSAESAMSVMDAAVPLKRDLIGVGLDSDEFNNPPDKFRAVFAKAKAAGLHLTMHVDVNQVDVDEHIRQVIEDIGVERIDHGGNVLDSPALIALAKAHNIYFTVCPIFSGGLNGVSARRDVVRGMLDAGLKVTINSDDPAYMGGNYINESFAFAQAHSHLTKAEMVQISRNAFEACWISEAERAGYLAKLDAFAQTWGVRT